MCVCVLHIESGDVTLNLVSREIRHCIFGHDLALGKCYQMQPHADQRTREEASGEVNAESANCAWFCFTNLHSRTMRTNDAVTTRLMLHRTHKKNHQQPCQNTVIVYFVGLDNE